MRIVNTADFEKSIVSENDQVEVFDHGNQAGVLTQAIELTDEFLDDVRAVQIVILQTTDTVKASELKLRVIRENNTTRIEILARLQ